MQIRPFDVFAAVVFLVYLLFSRLLSYELFLRYWGGDNIAEFYVYAVAILASLILTWLAFRDYDWRPSLLFLVVIGILLHCAGSIPIGEGRRIYDLIFLGIRFDKVVHFFFAFVAVRVVMSIIDHEKISIGRLEGVAVVLIVVGIGACWELVEFMVVKTIPHNGVGLYDNNMADLLSNLLGAVFSRGFCAISWQPVKDAVLNRGRTS